MRLGCVLIFLSGSIRRYFEMDKMFKFGAVCPLKGCEVGCPQCVQCSHYVRDGTGTFIWCDKPQEIAEKRSKIAEKCTKVAPKGRKITKKANKKTRK